MATNYMSAGVDFTEVDNTLTVPSPGVWSGAAVIQAGWGPVNDPQYITSENELVTTFGKPNQNNFRNWLTAANYLAYSGSMYVTRANSDKLCNASSEPIAKTTSGIAYNLSTSNIAITRADTFEGYEKGSDILKPFIAVYANVKRYAYIRSEKQAIEDGSYIVVNVYEGSVIPTQDDLNNGTIAEVTVPITSKNVTTATEYEQLSQTWKDLGVGVGTKQASIGYYKTYMITPGVNNVKNRVLYYKDLNGNQSAPISYYTNGNGSKYKKILSSGLCDESSFVEYIRVKRTNEDGRSAYEMYSGLSGITETSKKITNGTYFKVDGYPHTCKISPNKYTLESPTTAPRTYLSYIDLDDEEYLLIDDEYGDADAANYPKMARETVNLVVRDYDKRQTLTHKVGVDNLGLGGTVVYYGVLDSSEQCDIDGYTDLTWQEYRDSLAEKKAYKANGNIPVNAEQVAEYAAKNNMIYGKEYYDSYAIPKAGTYVWNEILGDFMVAEDYEAHTGDDKTSVTATEGKTYINIDEGSSYKYLKIGSSVLQQLKMSENVINNVYYNFVVPENESDAKYVVVDFYYAKILDSNLLPIDGAGFAIKSEDWVVRADNKSFIQYNSKSSDYFSIGLLSTDLTKLKATITKNPIIVKPNYLTILNDQDYELNYADGQGTYGEFCCKYPGKLGNSIMVTYADSTNFKWWSRPVQDDFGNVVEIEDFTKYFSYEPGTSVYAQERGASNDEIHLLVIDMGGLITGTKGTILEKYEHLSKAKNARGIDGDSIYYAKVLQQKSKYVYCIDNPIGKNWGENVLDENGDGNTFDPASTNNDGYPTFHFLSGGNDDYNSTDGQLMEAFEFYKNREKYDIINIVCGAVSPTVSKWVVENICEVKRDCVAFCSIGGESPVVSTSDTKTALAQVAYRESKLSISSSYLFIDSGFKQQYDKYNDEYRTIPLCGDIAGLWAHTNEHQDYGFSAAGYNRGFIKNVNKLIFSPSREQRDILYPKSINPVFSEPGSGSLLFGDRTSLMKPSAFRFMNVRYLFIYLERILTAAAKYSLFEINDSVSRANLIALVTPTLDRCIGNRTITAYKVVCDSSNNTPEMIDNGEMHCDIKIIPNRSIQWIQLNFSAEKSGTTFSES